MRGGLAERDTEHLEFSHRTIFLLFCKVKNQTCRPRAADQSSVWNKNKVRKKKTARAGRGAFSLQAAVLILHERAAEAQ